MSVLSGLASKWAKVSPFTVLPREQWASQRPTYKDAEPAIIDAALARSQRRPSGNWYVFAASDSIRKRPFGTSVGGVEIVAWRDVDGTLQSALATFDATLIPSCNRSGPAPCSPVPMVRVRS